MQTEVFQGKGFLHLQVTDSLSTIQDCQQFVQVIKQLSLEPGARIYLDFNQISFITGSFVGFLVTSLKFLQDKSCRVVFITNQQEVIDILELTGTSRMVPVLAEMPSLELHRTNG